MKRISAAHVILMMSLSLTACGVKKPPTPIYATHPFAAEGASIAPTPSATPNPTVTPKPSGR